MQKGRVISLIISIIMLVSLCSCGSKETALHELYQNEKIKTLNTNIPVTIDISIVDKNTHSYSYDISDSVLIQKIADAFMLINVTDTAKTEEFYGKYFIDLFWEGETAHIHLNDEIAEIIYDNDVNYYRIENAENFLTIISAEVESNSEAMLNYDSVISESNVDISVMKDISFDEKGNCLLNVFVLNRNANMITVTPTEVKANGESVNGCPSFSIQSDSELGFQIPVDTADIKELKKISMRFEVSFTNSEDTSPFLTTDQYTIDIG